MKIRYLTLACMLSLILTVTPVFATDSLPEVFYNQVSLENISDISSINTNVLELTPLDMKLIDTDFTPNQMRAFLYRQGLIVYRDDDGISFPALDNYLNLPIQENTAQVPVSESINSTSLLDNGKDIAVIYYLDNQGAISTHTINVASDDDNYNLYDQLIDDTVYSILVNMDAQNEESTPNASLSVNSISGDYLNTKTYTYTRPPKGKLVVDYEFYTAQNINSNDYYMVFCDINGIPGAVLHDDDSSYQSQYEGEEMVVDISPVTTSVELDDYGPDRTITSSAVSYGVDITVGLQDVSITHSTSYTRNISDTEIATKCTSTDARWELSIYDPAQADNCRFEPAAVFVCSNLKYSVTLDCFASYTLDSLFTAQDVIDLSRSLTCTASNVLEE